MRKPHSIHAYLFHLNLGQISHNNVQRLLYIISIIPKSGHLKICIINFQLKRVYKKKYLLSYMYSI